MTDNQRKKQRVDVGPQMKLIIKLANKDFNVTLVNIIKRIYEKQTKWIKR